jgi:hypothetical protein
MHTRQGTVHTSAQAVVQFAVERQPIGRGNFARGGRTVDGNRAFLPKRHDHAAKLPSF